MRFKHSRFLTRASAVFVGLVLSSGNGGAVRAEDGHAPAPVAVTGAAITPAGITPAAWEGMRASIERDQYALGRDGDAYVATNPRHRLQVTFSPTGVDVRPRAGEDDWHFGLRLAGYGYGNRRERAAEATHVVDGNRIEYRRGALVEWYVNERRGVEQGFTLAEPPAGRRAGVPLVVHLTATGTLRPTLGSDGRRVEWRDAQGKQALWYRGLVVIDAEGRTLPSRMEVEGPRLRLRVDDDGATYPLTIDPFIEVARLTASDASIGDFLGWSVAIHGDTAVVGAYGDDDSGESSGAAYIFERSQANPNAWEQVAKLTAGDAAAADFFGVRVAISGDTVLVSAYGDDDSGSASGAVYVFERLQGSPDAWSEVVKLTASDAAAGAVFGSSVAISGDTAVVGAHSALVQGLFYPVRTGAAYVFERNHPVANAWGEAAKLAPSNERGGQYFGFSASISGDTVLVGAFNYEGEGGRGAAYVFNRHQGGENNWGHVVKLRPNDLGWERWFGYSVSLSGDYALIGDYQSGDAGFRSGAAYVFERDQGSWSQVAKLTASDAAGGDQFGFSVSIDAEAAVIGAPYDAYGGAVRGSAYVFRRNDEGEPTWREVAKLTPSVNSGHFGSDVAVSDETVVVGDHTGFGAAYVFGSGGDDTSPVLALPNEIVAEATSPVGAVVSYIASALDDADGSITPDCDRPSGATFSIGTTTVTCTATDSAGNASTGQFPVTVQDTTPPALTPPPDLTVEATGPHTPVAIGAATAVDLVDSNPAVTNNAPATFPLGPTVVTWTTTDAIGNSSIAIQRVTVEDTTSPALTLPAPMRVEANSRNGAVVSYTTSALDVVDGAVPPVCVPASGTTFPLGTITVRCTATDGAGNSSRGEFPVTVHDTTPPVIACNAPATITPPMAPIWFTATATEAVSTPTTRVTSYSCTAVNGSGRLIDKSESCIVETNGAAVQILDSGGVGDHISWTVTSSDEAGNESTAACAVDVVNPGGGGR